ncbi:MAG: succinylglutamate desuccinylase/aspartoacylase family protein, partial [Gammaproteobacteria bacterium]|nr:succinylglutamate desuccinylase/aspartoacylase family protein [Gammaproteobacteria bacterium]MBV1730946.1 succinylglutamate desuccinylase/aspartoacylase family protein [Hydrogenophaga sp.]
MQQINHPLLSPALGTQRHLSSWHFGQPGLGPKVYVQASLHADELPGMLVAHHLRGLLETAERDGQLLGEVVLVPFANPIGLDQTTMHHQLGRFELASMENFNRNYPDFFALVRDEVADQLGLDAAQNKRLIRDAMRRALDAQKPQTELQSLRQTLMQLSHDADIVLDLHCDYEAVLHLY